MQGPRLNNLRFLKGIAFLETNFGVEYSNEKVQSLFARLIEDDWSEYRFIKTVKWFADTKKFAAWTIADWFEFTIPIHNYSWYCKQCAERIPTITWEITRGVFGYTEAGVNLPFKNVSAR